MYTPKFIHLRRHDPFNRFGYPNPAGGATVAYIPLNADRTRYAAAVARCNTGEHYVKRIGRSVSAGRLEKNFYTVAVDIDKDDPVTDQIMTALANVGLFNNWKY
jgi:hypothetical protein